MKILRIVAAVLVGAVVSRIVLDGGSMLIRTAWPAYAVAEPDRAYSLAMLFVRLVMFSTMIAAVSASGTLVARDHRFSWLAGSIILAISIPPHLYPGHVWEFYPPWYHIVYLVSILPIAFSAGHLSRRFVPKPRVAAPAV
jgi:hypothetical protein